MMQEMKAKLQSVYSSLPMGSESGGWFSRWGRRIVLFLAQAGLLVLIVYFAQERLRHSWEAISWENMSLQISYVISAATVQAGAFMLTAFSWSQILHALSSPISTNKATLIWLKSQPFKYLPSGLGVYVGRSVLLLQEGASKSLIVQSSAVEVALVLLTGAVFAAPLAFENVGRSLGPIIALFLVPALILLLRAIALTRWGNRPIFRSGLHLSGLAEIPCSRLASLCLWYSLRWLLLGLSLTMLAAAFSLDSFTHYGYFVPAYACAWMVGFLTPLPGGLGAREVVMTILLESVLPSSALTLALASRLVWIVGELLTAVVGWVWSGRVKLE